MSQKATDLIQHNQLRICHQFYCVMLIMRKPFKLNTINPNYNENRKHFWVNIHRSNIYHFDWRDPQ